MRVSTTRQNSHLTLRILAAFAIAWFVLLATATHSIAQQSTSCPVSECLRMRLVRMFTAAFLPRRPVSVW